MMTQYKRQFFVFFEFLRRDIYVQSQTFGRIFTSYAILFPITNGLSAAYLRGHTYFVSNWVQTGTMLFCGEMLFLFAIAAFKLTIDLFFDLHGSRYIEYQIGLLSPRLLLVERVICAALITFLISLPPIPIVKLLLWGNFDLHNANWLKFVTILFCASLCTSAYFVCIALIIKRPAQISSIWSRFNFPLLALGGAFVPWSIINQYSPLLGKLTLLNPFVYASEGVRQAILGGKEFFSWSLCCTMLILFSCFFTVASWRLLKKRIDYV